jgi:hypothetical protein
MLHIQSRTLNETTLSWGKALMAGVAATVMTFGIVANAGAVNVSGCEFDQSVPGTWSLQGDCSTTGPINIPADTTVEGNNHTISAAYSFGSNLDGTNTVIGVIDADGVTINDLTVDGAGGTNLHGVNVYDSSDVTLDNVTIKNNDKSGLVVNSSTVTVNNLTTENNSWHGVNVDQRTSSPASLTINGVSRHDEQLQVYIDDSTKLVQVVDTNNQYNRTNPRVNGRVNDANYVLKKPIAAETKDDCKNGRWETAFQTDYKNQGDCVSSVASNDKAKGNPSVIDTITNAFRGLFN